MHAIQSVANGLYVSAELGYASTDQLYGLLRARAPVAQGWEQIVFLGDCHSQTGCAIYSLTRHWYVTAGVDYPCELSGALFADPSAPSTPASYFHIS